MGGGKVRTTDDAVALKRAGVKQVIRVGDAAVAVVADTWWRAKTAVDALPIEWDLGPNAQASSSAFATTLKAGLDAEQAFVGNSNGDIKAGLAGAARKVSAVYSFPHQNHATMEPMNATVKFTMATATSAARCEVWTPTQNAEAAHGAVVAASGLSAPQCDVYKLLLGGGFGRRSLHDWVTEAVLIAKEMPGVPIKLLWTREEDMQQGAFHPVT